jgi:hypothetical protein
VARNTTGLKRGGPGRPAGSQNQATKEIKEASRALVEDPKYVASLKVRLESGKAPHMETLLFHYAYGKPKETVQFDGDVRLRWGGKRG